MAILSTLMVLLLYIRFKSTLTLLWLISSFLWVAMPAVLNDTYDVYDRLIDLSGKEKFLVGVIELISSVFWVLPFLLGRRKLLISSGFLVSIRVAFISFFWIGVFLIFSSFVGLNLVLPLRFLYVTLSVKIAVIYAVYIVYSNRRIYVRILALVLFLIYALGGGSLGPIVLGLILAIILSYRNRQWYKRTVLFGIVGIVLISLFGNTLHMIRALDVGKADKMATSEKISLLLGYSNEVDLLETGAKHLDAFSNIVWRFGENRRVSAGYLRYVELHGFVGLAPVINSVKAIVPRSYWPEKPEPGSIDGSKYGKGMYIIHKYTYGNGKNMSGFYTGLHSYWEYGLVGMMCVSFFIGLIQYALTSFFLSFGRQGEVLLIAVYSIWWEMPKLWLSEVVLHLVTIYLPFMLIVGLIYSYVLFSKRRTR